MEKNISASSSQHIQQASKRAFQGLAGSPLAKVRRGRPRKWASDAERMRAKRKAAKNPSQHDWNVRLVKESPSVSEGLYLPDAPHGQGMLITGGYNSNKIATIQSTERQYKRNTTGTGSGPDEFEKDALPDSQWKETDDTFHDKHPYPANGNYPSSPAKARSLKKIKCPLHPQFEANGNERPAKIVSRKCWIVTLECGCTRDSRKPIKADSVRLIEPERDNAAAA